MQIANLLLRGLVVVLIVFLSAYSVYYAQNSSYFEVKEIHYQGIVHVDREALDSLIRGAFAKNVLLLDLERVRRLVESEPWVKSARIRRKLPNQIFVYIAEREAAAVAAIENELHLVDPDGVILDQYGARYGSIDKPIVKGLKNVAQENAQEENAVRMQMYLRVLRELNSPQKDYSQTISEIDVQDLERVAVVPSDDPVHVYLGNNKFLRRYQIFLSKKDLFRQLKEQYGTIESIDVSYENKIIFHTPQNKEETIVTERREQGHNGEKEVAYSRN